MIIREPRFGDFGDDATFGDDLSTHIDSLDDYIGQLANALRAYCASNPVGCVRVKPAVEAWFDLAQGFGKLSGELKVNPAAKYPDGSLKAKVWAEIGPRIVKHVETNFKLIDDNTLAAQVGSFLRTFPAALSYVIDEFTKKVGNIAAGASLAFVKPLLIVGGAITLVSFLMRKSGATVRTPFFKVGR